MNIEALDTVTRSESGVEFEIKDPRTGRGLGGFITMLGPDSKAYRNATKEILKQASDDMQMDELETERAIRCTTGWRGIEDAAGKEIRFTEAELRSRVSKAPTIRDQMVAFHKARSNFLPAPPVASSKP